MGETIINLLSQHRIIIWTGDWLFEFHFMLSFWNSQISSLVGIFNSLLLLSLSLALSSKPPIGILLEKFIYK